MNNKLAKIILALCVISFIFAALILTLRHLVFFSIKEIEVNVSGPVTELNSNMNRCINPYRGMNIFSANTNNLKRNLLSFEGVKEVEVRKYYPSKLIVDVVLKSYNARIFVTRGNKTEYYMADMNGINRVEKETYAFFSNLAEVKLDYEYADYILKWGSDNGFAQMCALSTILGDKFLIRDLKYNNNSTENFGVLRIEINDPNSILYVKEAVTKDRLLEALNIIMDNKKGAMENVSYYDLYSSALVKRKRV